MRFNLKKTIQKDSVSTSSVNQILLSPFNENGQTITIFPNTYFLMSLNRINQPERRCPSLLWCGNFWHRRHRGGSALRTLKDYFSRYPLSVRNPVRSIVIDRYFPYLQLIQEMIPKAAIVTDRFHAIHLNGWPFDKTRFKVMNADEFHYTKLKRYWNLFWKPRLEWDDQNYRWFPYYRKLISEWAIVNGFVDCSPKRFDTYEVYQALLYAMKSIDRKRLKWTLATCEEDHP